MLIRFVLGHVAARAWLISNRCSMPVRPGADAFCSDPQRSAVQRQAVIDNHDRRGFYERKIAAPYWRWRAAREKHG